MTWTDATAELKAAQADVVRAGVLGLAPHVEKLEAALADGATAFPSSPAANGMQTVLVDGPNEMVMVMTMANKDKKPTITQANPYPVIALYLGSYYNEAKNPDEALRVLDLGRKLHAVQGMDIGAMLPRLYSERAAAFNNLKRWADALASCDDGLKIASMPDIDRARLERSRGFALVELGRLDDAEAAYQQSLTLAPNNALAQNELKYIARLRSGGSKAPTGQVLSGQPLQTAKPN